MSVASAILAELTESDLDQLADLLAPLLAERMAPRTEPDAWMTTRQAAGYLGLTVPALHRLTASREVPFEQDGPGCKCWFRRSDLDRWRRGESASRPVYASKSLPNGRIGAQRPSSRKRENPA